MITNCKLIAEIGWNFIGDMTLAKEMIFAAKESGADFAKFQTWSTKNLVDGPWTKDGRLELYKKAELTEKNHIELMEYCTKINIKFLTSVFNISYLDFLKNLNMKIIKVASMEINNIELIQKLSNIYEKLIISTGASKIEDIAKVLEIVDKKKLILMHCVSSYPTQPENINLPRIKYLQTLGCEVGYSGHLKGINDAIGSLSYGVNYIEKHFTIDNNLPGRDNQLSILPHEMKIISNYIKDLNLMNIDHGIELQEIEREVYNNYRNRWGKN
jgi:N,N'-diacetyllegionaminate synthase